MMKNPGIVVEENGDFVTILSMRQSACGSSCESCSSHCESEPMRVKAVNTIHAEIGDRVEMEISSNRVLSYIGLIYGIPLVTFLIGVVTSYAATGNELISFAVGIVVLALTYIAIKAVDSRKNFTGSDIKLRKITS
ncbi:SoxR reducing system RseC family protein [Peptoniphilus equinus]|uniref:SoxR reducing system RseC family protein n=1 Tax=Peptoniphilus equinus TaxID=3016343 RepID=A0ABY7QV44_9FIRM|nr:SoxR reducing system RseC family protein [Peptoniphilus equinus]WBW50658.1 SoxR reducing system RseC family protein [Peptoniphilus equinus]